MSKFTDTTKTIIRNLSNLATTKYQESKVFVSSLNGGFNFLYNDYDKLINEGYASNTDVYSIISKIIRTGANIPYEIVKRNTDGTEEVLTSGAFYDSVMQPNKRQNKFEFTEDALGYQLTTGNELLYGMKPAGMDLVSQVHIVPTQYVQIKRIGKQLFDYSLAYTLRYKGFETPLTEEEIKHIRYFNPTCKGVDEGMGLSPLQAGFNTVMASNELMTAQANALKNRGANGMLSNDSENAMDEEEFENLQNKVLQKLGQADKFNRIVGTTAKVKYTQFGLSPSDLKMIENGVLTLRQLCSLYGADSSSFNDPANKKFNNLKEGQKSFYINAVLPPLQRHLLGYKELVIPGWNKQDNADYDIRLDLSGIEALQDDQAAEVQKQVNLSKGISDVIMRVGEGKIKPDSAVQILMWSFDMNETEARELVANTGEIEETNNTVNE